MVVRFNDQTAAATVAIAQNKNSITCTKKLTCSKNTVELTLMNKIFLKSLGLRLKQ